MTYAQCRKWSPQKFTYILQPYFLIGNILNLVVYANAGIVKSNHISVTLYSLPFIFLAAYLGQILQKRSSAQFFEKVVNLSILIIE